MKEKIPKGTFGTQGFTTSFYHLRADILPQKELITLNLDSEGGGGTANHHLIM